MELFPLSVAWQMGGPEPCILGSREVRLPFNQLLKKYITATHCPAIDFYALVMRVDGSIWSFGAEEITRLRFAKKSRYITIDIQVPQSVWEPLDLLESKMYLAEKTKGALLACTQRLARDKLPVDESRLFSQLDSAISEFIPR
jgi:hypothetical protein